jgi:hypothetical protein
VPSRTRGIGVSPILPGDIDEPRDQPFLSP